MKKVVIIVLLITITLSITVVKKYMKKEIKKSLMYDEKEIAELKETNYDYDEMIKKFKPSFTIFFKTKKIGYCSKEKILIIDYDSNGEKIASNLFKISVPYVNFKRIKQGDNIKKIMEIDPNGDYLLLYTGVRINYSQHYTEDGYYIIILYDDNFNVNDIIVQKES